jgi:hypothetical protein
MNRMIVGREHPSPSQTFFWDWHGVIHVDFLTDARTVSAAYYSDLLATDVKEKIRVF